MPFDWLNMDSFYDDTITIERTNKKIASILSSIRVGGISQYLAYRLVCLWKGAKSEKIKWEVLELGIGYLNEYGGVRLNKNVYEMFGREAERMREEHKVKYPHMAKLLEDANHYTIGE